MSEETQNDLPEGYENPPTFTARIVETPDKGINGEYQTTYIRELVDKKTLQTDSLGYYDKWYQFLGILTSMVVSGEECEIPPDFKVNICIQSKQNGLPIKKLQYILVNIRLDCDIEFKGVPKRVDISGKFHIVDPTNIADAEEIYISPNYVDTIKVERLTQESQEKQTQFARSKVKERSKARKMSLWFEVKWFWKETVEYIKENKIQIFVGIIIGIVVASIGSVIGNLVINIFSKN